MDLLKKQQALAIEKERKRIERWHLTRTKGKWRYILLFTLWNGLAIGTIVAGTISLVENGLSPQKFVAGWPLGFFLIFFVLGSLLGLCFGWRQWNFYESVHLKRQSDRHA